VLYFHLKFLAQSLGANRVEMGVETLQLQLHDSSYN